MARGPGKKKKEPAMKSSVLAVVAVLVLASTSYGGWYVVPQGVYTYYPYSYPYYAAAPVYAYPPPVVAAPQVAYSPILPGPRFVYSPVVPAPVFAPAPAPYWYGPPAVVVRGRFYVPGQPVRNVVRWAVP
jgi:hypothetical protein